MELNITVPGGKAKQGKVSVSDAVFAQDYNEALIHQVVTTFQTNTRAGTKAQKTRSEVRGGGKKPFRQKGTGRARAGTTRSPIWVGGGVTFAAKPRDYTQKVNKKMLRGALRSIFSELVREERLIVLETIELKESKTRELKAQLDQLELDNLLIITDEVNSKLFLASRNLPNVEVLDVQGIDPVSLVRFKKVIVTVPALKQLGEWLG